MFFQRAPIEEVEAMIKTMKSTPIGLEPVREALFTKVHDVIKLIQNHSNFNEHIQGTNLFFIFILIYFIFIIN